MFRKLRNCLYDLRVYLMVFVIGQLQQLFRSCNIKYFFSPVSHSVRLVLAKKRYRAHMAKQPIAAAFGLFQNFEKFICCFNAISSFLCDSIFWINLHLRRSLLLGENNYIKIPKPTDVHSKIPPSLVACVIVKPLAVRCHKMCSVMHKLRNRKLNKSFLLL
jgi:hypothetical protein